MQKQNVAVMALLVLVLLLLFPRPAYAYMDPGTTGSVFAMLAPFIAIFLAFLGFLIRPFRRFIVSILAKLRGHSTAQPLRDDEQPVSDYAPDSQISGEDTVEDSEG